MNLTESSNEETLQRLEREVCEASQNIARLERKIYQKEREICAVIQDHLDTTFAFKTVLACRTNIEEIDVVVALIKKSLTQARKAKLQAELSQRDGSHEGSHKTSMAKGGLP